MEMRARKTAQNKDSEQKYARGECTKRSFSYCFCSCVDKRDRAFIRVTFTACVLTAANNKKQSARLNYIFKIKSAGKTRATQTPPAYVDIVPILDGSVTMY